MVGFPVAETFSEVVSMNLKMIQKLKLWFLYMINGATKHMVGALIDTKKREIIIDCIF